MIETLVILAHRLGLGWLVGRRYVVITTEGAGKEPVHHVSRFTYRDGEVIVPVDDEGTPWLQNLGTKNVAMLAAAPGPLSSVAERRNGSVAFRPTGHPTFYPVDSDLIWVIPVVAFGMLLARRLR